MLINRLLMSQKTFFTQKVTAFLVLLILACHADVIAAEEKILSFPEGRFEQVAEGSLPAGWDIPRWLQKGFEVQTENGDSFLRFSWEHEGLAWPDCRIKVDSGWQRVELSMCVRVHENLKGRFMFKADLLDAAGKPFDLVGIKTVDQPCGWSTLTIGPKRLSERAAFIKIMPGFNKGAGTVDMDDFTISVQPRENAAGIPVQVNVVSGSGKANTEKKEISERKNDDAVSNHVEPTPMPAAPLIPVAEWSEEPVEALTVKRGRIVLNGSWNFMPAKEIPQNGTDSTWGMKRVPGSWLPWGPPERGSIYAVESKGRGAAWQGVNLSQLDNGWYARTVEVPMEWAGRALILEFSRISREAVIFINGIRAGRISSPFGTLDITPLLKPGETATLHVFVDASPPEGTGEQAMAKGVVHKIQKMVSARGIIGDAILWSRPMGAHVSDVFVQPSTRKKQVALDIELVGVTKPGRASFVAEMVNEDGAIEKTLTASAEIKAVDVQTVAVTMPWDDPRLWDLGQPNLYTLRLQATAPGLNDNYWQPFGFREFWIEGRKFYLNGKEFRLRPTKTRMYWGIPELIDASIDSSMALGFNFEELWPGQPWEEMEYQDVVARRADLKGWPISAIHEHAHEATENWGKHGVEQAFRKRVEQTARKLRNHPSILMWGTTANRGMHDHDQNPRNLGRQAFADSNEAKYRVNAKETLAIMKAEDPTRPIFWHASLIGDFPTTNCYLNFIPLQEREEWLSDWVKNGQKPWMAVEFGLPLDLSFLRSRTHYDIEYTEPLATEWLATYLGPDAYREETDELWRLNSESFNDSGQDKPMWPKGRFKHHRLSLRPILGEIESQPTMRRFLDLYIRNTYRSWRTMGSTSLPIPWLFEKRWKYPGNEREAIALPSFRPGRLGAWQPTQVKGAFQILPDEKGKVYPMWAALREANSQTLAWICGPEETFTAKDHSFWAGAELEKAVAALNDTRDGQAYKFHWLVRVGGQEIASSTAEGTLAVAETKLIPIRVKLPLDHAGEKVDGEIVVKGNIGSDSHHDRFAFRVFKRPSKVTRAVQIFDPAGKTSAMLEELGYRTAAWDGRPTDDILILGRESLKQALPGPLPPVLEKGGRVLVMAQSPDWMEGALGLRVAKHMSRYVFKISDRHPVGRGLDNRDLCNWAGTSSLVDPYPEYGTANELPPYGWHWGNRGALTSGAIEKPHHAGWRPILECEFDNAYTPLMELDYGKGRMIWCALDLEDYVPRDPAATVLAKQLIEYAAESPSTVRNEVFLLGLNEQQQALMSQIGLIASATQGFPERSDLVVIGSSASVEDQKLHRFLQEGGRIMYLTPGADRAPLGVTIQKGVLDGPITEVPHWTELRGISLSDLHARGPQDVPLVTSGAEIAAQGSLARKAVGKGGAVFCMLSPEQLDADRLKYFRYTRWRQTRLIAQILANMGASFELDKAIPALQSGSDRISIAGTWKVKAFGLQKGSLDIGDKLAYSPPSKAAVDAALPETNPATWETAEAPGMWKGFAGPKVGEAVFRRVVNIPSAWQGKDLILSLGAVDDFDTTYWNGEEVGKGEGWNKPRMYSVPAQLVKPGPNLIAVRLFNNFREGGFGAKNPSEMYVKPKTDDTQERVSGYYHSDYRTDHALGDNPYRYVRW